jgi:hypothetical protein
VIVVWSFFLIFKFIIVAVLIQALCQILIWRRFEKASRLSNLRTVEGIVEKKI